MGDPNRSGSLLLGRSFGVYSGTTMPNESKEKSCGPQEVYPPMIRGIRAPRISCFGPARPALFSSLFYLASERPVFAPVLGYPTFRFDAIARGHNLFLSQSALAAENVFLGSSSILIASGRIHGAFVVSTYCFPIVLGQEG
jgi:hypothetical protein